MTRSHNKKQVFHTNNQESVPKPRDKGRGKQTVQRLGCYGDLDISFGSRSQNGNKNPTKSTLQVTSQKPYFVSPMRWSGIEPASVQCVHCSTTPLPRPRMSLHDISPAHHLHTLTHKRQREGEREGGGRGRAKTGVGHKGPRPGPAVLSIDRPGLLPLPRTVLWNTVQLR
jgi:hypothetical protein